MSSETQSNQVEWFIKTVCGFSVITSIYRAKFIVFVW